MIQTKPEAREFCERRKKNQANSEQSSKPKFTQSFSVLNVGQKKPFSTRGLPSSKKPIERVVYFKKSNLYKYIKKKIYIEALSDGTWTLNALV